MIETNDPPILQGQGLGAAIQGFRPNKHVSPPEPSYVSPFSQEPLWGRVLVCSSRSTASDSEWKTEGGDRRAEMPGPEDPSEVGRTKSDGGRVILGERGGERY